MSADSSPEFQPRAVQQFPASSHYPETLALYLSGPLGLDYETLYRYTPRLVYRQRYRFTGQWRA